MHFIIQISNHQTQANIGYNINDDLQFVNLYLIVVEHIQFSALTLTSLNHLD